MRGITISKLSDEFIIHCIGENDLNLISNKRTDLILVIDEAYSKIKKKRLNFAEINEKSLNPYIEYKTKTKDIKKKPQKAIKNKKKEKTKHQNLDDRINISINDEEIHKSLNMNEQTNDKIELNENMNLNSNENLNKKIENFPNDNYPIEVPLSPSINDKNKKFDDLDDNINLSEIEKLDNNIINSDIKSNPLLEKKESPGTLFSSHKNIKEVKMEDFKLIKIIGRGSFGKVCLVEYLPNHEIYAMKSLKKDILIKEDKIESTLLEKEILETVNHPFIINLIFCFQTEERINFVMPFIPGGELFQHLKNVKHLGENTTRFYAAQIAVAIQHLHDMGYIYRDLKPENILIDAQGYLRLTDFGLAKKVKNGEKSNSFCGTPEYLAPEIIKGEYYDKNVDWWSFGILIYEMICGIPPFYLRNLKKMYDLIKNEKIKFDKKFLVSKEAKDLITKLLEKNVENRLCYHSGIEAIKSHHFFKSINFDELLKKKIEAPFIPTIRNSTDVRNFDELFTNEKLEMSSITIKNIDLVKENQYKFDIFKN